MSMSPATISATMSAPSTAPSTATSPSSNPRLATTKYGYSIGPTGETFEFAASARSSGDKMFRFVWTLAPGKKGPGEHYHSGETETFEIVSGRIRIWLNGEANDYGPGDRCVVEPGARHKFLNPGAEPVVINVSLDGPRMEDMLVPIAVQTHGRKGALRDFMRLFAGMDAGASVPASRAELVVVGALSALLRVLGFKPYPAVIGWDGPEHRA